MQLLENCLIAFLHWSLHFISIFCYSILPYHCLLEANIELSTPLDLFDYWFRSTQKDWISDLIISNFIYLKPQQGAFIFWLIWPLWTKDQTDKSASFPGTGASSIDPQQYAVKNCFGSKSYTTQTSQNLTQWQALRITVMCNIIIKSDIEISNFLANCLICLCGSYRGIRNYIWIVLWPLKCSLSYIYVHL